MVEARSLRVRESGQNAAALTAAGDKRLQRFVRQSGLCRVLWRLFQEQAEFVILEVLLNRVAEGVNFMIRLKLGSHPLSFRSGRRSGRGGIVLAGRNCRLSAGGSPRGECV